MHSYLSTLPHGRYYILPLIKIRWLTTLWFSSVLLAKKCSFIQWCLKIFFWHRKGWVVYHSDLHSDVQNKKPYKIIRINKDFFSLQAIQTTAQDWSYYLRSQASCFPAPCCQNKIFIPIVTEWLLHP